MTISILDKTKITVQNIITFHLAGISHNTELTSLILLDSVIHDTHLGMTQLNTPLGKRIV